MSLDLVIEGVLVWCWGEVIYRLPQHETENIFLDFRGVCTYGRGVYYGGTLEMKT